MRIRLLTSVICGLGLALSIPSGGAAGVSSPDVTELVRQAGFRAIPADTPEKLDRLEQLTPALAVVPRQHDGQTIYTLADPFVCRCLPHPAFVDGIQQQPIEGASFAHSFDDAGAQDRHTTQYFELGGNRGIYHEGWSVCTKHVTPWELGRVAIPAFDDDVWELYAPGDWSQAESLADTHRELQQLFWLRIDLRGDAHEDPAGKQQALMGRQ